MAGGAIIVEEEGGYYSPIRVEMDLEVDSAFPVETIALLGACELGRCLGGEISIHTDCKGAMAAVRKRNRGFKRIMGEFRLPDNISVNKIQAHPERRSGDWNNGEKGIFLADYVAGGEGGNIPIFKSTDILEGVAERSKVTIIDDCGVPFVGDIKRRSSKRRMERYFKKRDEYRDRLGKQSIWEGCSFHLIQKMLGKNDTMEDRCASLRIGAQKRWATSQYNEELCKACGNKRRSMKHVLLKCADSRMSKVRKIWMSEVSKRIARIRNRDVRGAIEEVWTKMKNNTGGEYAMCGIFQNRFVENLYRGKMEVHEGEDRTIMRILRQIGEGAREMIKIYMEIKGVEGMERELRQTNMVGYFGRKGKGIEVANINKGRIARSKKKKSRKKGTVQLRKGGYVVVGGEGGTVYWDFKAG
jgi:hypothetical protein